MTTVPPEPGPPPSESAQRVVRASDANGDKNFRAQRAVGQTIVSQDLSALIVPFDI